MGSSFECLLNVWLKECLVNVWLKNLVKELSFILRGDKKLHSPEKHVMNKETLKSSKWGRPRDVYGQKF